MFLFNVSEDPAQEFGIKGMNCPLHCVMFDRFNVSYKDLPLRLADFGALHRNEPSGSLTGLTRVRKFSQDDAHIFCSAEQLSGEIQDVLEFMGWFYGLFDFQFELELSTRPEKYIGDLGIWDKAEQVLRDELNRSGKKWAVDPGDGAFYGPKIDVKIKDSLGRAHQCATIQLDFNLPERFELEYQNEFDDRVRPIMIHRAILGSFERFIAILTEHTQGKWPFWLSPRQIAIVPITSKNLSYAQELEKDLRMRGYTVELDTSDKHFKVKIRDAEKLHTNHLLVVGGKEESSRGVNLRAGGKQQFCPYGYYLGGLERGDSFEELFSYSSDAVKYAHACLTVWRKDCGKVDGALETYRSFQGSPGSPDSLTARWPAVAISLLEWSIEEEPDISIAFNAALQRYLLMMQFPHIEPVKTVRDGKVVSMSYPDTVTCKDVLNTSPRTPDSLVAAAKIRKLVGGDVVRDIRDECVNNEIYELTGVEPN